jgi:hypothetical protein
MAFVITRTGHGSTKLGLTFNSSLITGGVLTACSMSRLKSFPRLLDFQRLETKNIFIKAKLKIITVNKILKSSKNQSFK